LILCRDPILCSSTRTIRRGEGKNGRRIKGRKGKEENGEGRRRWVEGGREEGKGNLFSEISRKSNIGEGNASIVTAQQVESTHGVT
jgi:hypothetical protein